MRSLSIILLSNFLINASFAQAETDSTLSGEIYYTQTVNLHANMTGERAQWKSMVPETMTTQFKLLYSDEVYTYQMEEDLTEELSEQERRMRRWMGNPDDRYYGEIEEKKKIQEKTFMSKRFLIVGDWKKYDWKPTGEFAEINGYACMKAVYEDTAGQVIAWFTTEIALPIGPGEFNGLPGVILKLEVPEKHFVIEVKSIAFRRIDEKEIEKPKKGKEVTQEEFEEIVKEKIQEMRENGGGWGMH